MINHKKLLVFLLLCSFLPNVKAQVTPLPHAHAHNDYWHERPLLDALEHGFTSVEADALLIDGELYVGHDMPKGSHQLPTLQEAYLEPLKKRINQQNGQVYEGYEQPFYLMIDVKTDADSTYTQLKKTLLSYQDILSYSENGKYHPNAVKVFLSGNRPIESLKQDSLQLAGIDGRPDDLGKGYSATFMPVVSQHYRAIVDWDGNKPISKKQLKKLKKLTQAAHKEGKKVRLWATPENPLFWKTLLDAGVDLLNTDQLSDLQNFLSQQNK